MCACVYIPDTIDTVDEFGCVYVLVLNSEDCTVDFPHPPPPLPPLTPLPRSSLVEHPSRTVVSI